MRCYTCRSEDDEPRCMHLLARHLSRRPAEDALARPNGFAPIADYAAIGDCHGAALVARDGSVDWCCLGRFDADPTLCRLLDSEKGGFLSIKPTQPFTVTREYVARTNVLTTTFSTRTGAATVVDFMPVGRTPGARAHDYVSLVAPGWLVRIVRGLSGRVRLRIEYRASADFGRRPRTLRRLRDGVAAEGGPMLATGVDLAVGRELATGELLVHEGGRCDFVLASDLARRASGIALDRLLATTQAFWREWSDYSRYRGPYEGAVTRSALVLKLLTYAPSGAIVAAPTSSLPEQIGGERNWDYRYCWLRDAAFALYALGALGYSGEAHAFSRFVEERCRGASERVQIMYGIDGEPRLEERPLEHLEGYRGSRPVRVGNAAYEQHQLDVQGEVLDLADLHHALGARLDADMRNVVSRLWSFVDRHWHEPDSGLWESRSSPAQYVLGKVMSWAAADRAVRLLGPTSERLHTRDLILRTVQTEGTDRATGGLARELGGAGVDAALLLAPALGFPLGQATLEATIEAVRRDLQDGPFVRRYRDGDGVGGEEGAFLACSFWLVDALLFADRGREARDLFESLLGCANDVGLYSEEIDPRSRELLGNFPQALTHLALVQSATLLQMHEKGGARALEGTHADRVRRHVGATSGPWALWEAFKRSGRIGRVFSSRASMIPEIRSSKDAPQRSPTESTSS